MLPPPDSGINLGPLFLEISKDSRWAADPCEQHFPSSQRVADEHEQYLAFVKDAGQWDRYAKRLRTDHRARRDETFAEIAVAMMLANDGFPILRWEPPGANGKVGEYEIGVDDVPIFVEVKSPGWESEYDPADRDARTRQPKYIDGEARFIDQVTPIRQAVKKAMPKFSGTAPSLLVIADDLWFGLQEDPLSCNIALFSRRLHGATEEYSAEDGPLRQTRSRSSAR
jgi:hypothetical protein